ncbi:MAG TPA: TIGR03915 family putative DNA repair protein [Elusimicrobiales bacterium]|nr:TIGR03915 family putative DNA repair protein [Elusimicrobiales bacterium]
MGTYVYDHSFTGLICAIKAACIDASAEITLAAPAQENLFSPAVEIASDAADCAEFLRRLDAMTGPGTAENIKLSWLWSGPEKEKMLLSYARMAFSKGKALNDLLADPVVARTHKAAAAVLREAHRFKGFLRFTELSDRTLYARMEPDHNILPLVAGHFKRRMAASDWVIHDARRGEAALYFGGKLRLAELTGEQSPPRSETEARVAGLWRTFFDAVAIKERENPRAQRGGVPLKYRSNMPEFDALENLKPPGGA